MLAVVQADGQVCFDLSAAAETPGGTADFVDQSLLLNTYGIEFGLEVGLKFYVSRLVIGADEVSAGVETVGDSVA